MITFLPLLAVVSLCCIQPVESFERRQVPTIRTSAISLRLQTEDSDTGVNREKVDPVLSKSVSAFSWKVTAATIAAAALCFPQLNNARDARVTLAATASVTVLQKKTVMQIDPYTKPKKGIPEIQESVIPLDVTRILTDRFTVLRSDVTGEKLGQLRVGDSLVNRLRAVDSELDNVQEDIFKEPADWDVIAVYPKVLRAYSTLFTAYTDRAFPSDGAVDKALRYINDQY